MVGLMPKVKGSSMATAIEGEMPGMAPPRMPITTPAMIASMGVTPARL